MQGNGQTELVEALTGLRSNKRRNTYPWMMMLTHATPRKVTELGVAHIPEDRQKDGLVLPSR